MSVCYMGYQADSRALNVLCEGRSDSQRGSDLKRPWSLTKNPSLFQWLNILAIKEHCKHLPFKIKLIMDLDLDISLAIVGGGMAFTPALDAYLLFNSL